MATQLSREFNWLKTFLNTSGCDKLQTGAGTYVEGEFHIFTNTCKHEGETCPRLNMKSGEGYHLCQSQHAEKRLMDYLEENNLKSDGIVWMVGHYYVCEPCGKAMKDHGITEVRYREKV